MECIALPKFQHLIGQFEKCYKITSLHAVDEKRDSSLH